MKFLKVIVKVIVPVILIMALLCACGANKTQDLDTLEAQINSASLQGITEKDKAEIVGQLRTINEARNSLDVFWELGNGEKLEKSPYPSNPQPYYQVGRFSSIKEVKDFVLQYYTEEVANEYFFKYFEDPDEFYYESPCLFELDGILYADNRIGGRGGIVYNTYPIKFVETSENKVTVELTAYNGLEPDAIRTEKVTLVKENNRWVFNEIM